MGGVKMSINLRKGQKIDLTKGGGNGLKRIMVGLGWDEAAPQGFLSSLFTKQEDIDCDASVILCGENGKLIPGNELKDFTVFYNNLNYGNAIVHQGDNRTGAGDGDDEQIMVDLSRIPSNIAKLVFVVNIYEADKKKQHFGMIKNAFIRLVDMASCQEFCKFNLSENYNGMTGLVVGEIYRRNGEWKFNAIGQPVKEASNIIDMLRLYA